MHCIGSLSGVHTDGSNWLACDGHVKWMRGIQVSGGYTNPVTTNAQGQPAGYDGYASGTAALKGPTSTGFSLVALTFSPN